MMQLTRQTNSEFLFHLISDPTVLECDDSFCPVAINYEELIIKAINSALPCTI